LAILMGEGFSVFYEDADDRIWTRVGGVVIGLCYAALVLMVTRHLLERIVQRKRRPTSKVDEMTVLRARRGGTGSK
jgi:NhaP-type Na+/H+ or K+/H+ antiporter